MRVNNFVRPAGSVLNPPPSDGAELPLAESPAKAIPAIGKSAFRRLIAPRSFMKTQLSKLLALSRKTHGKIVLSRQNIRSPGVKVASEKGHTAPGHAKSSRAPVNWKLPFWVEGRPKAGRHGSLSGPEQWTALPASGGYRVQLPLGGDEDYDGRSDTERMVERGVTAAGNDQILQAAHDEDWDG